jgi:hypothetical protein
MRKLYAVITALICLIVLAACGTEAGVTPSPTAITPGSEPTMTSTSSNYPKTGHAPDYSWVAGRVTFTKIQGGCIYIYTDPADIKMIEDALTPRADTTVITGPIVSTAVGNSGSTSVPLRDMTPQTGPQPTEPPTSRFVPGGDGWDPSAHKDGEYVVLTGRLATSDDTREICPGGTAYVVDGVVRNP